ncbi:nuclease [Bacillus sp. J14TS2]|uniref:nuclease-related domain-containing protein n=1 Tax=Bacillus sp. J14TS2 TaxID=2807188 RepID=UPI001B19D664|nr:nuclease-related domain-containing protein [Bacillus sp. J14TS2]GIN74765.1 nuclease [Bacillus sp. J14TS2]
MKFPSESLVLQALQSTLHRLSPHHPQYPLILQKLRSKEAGIAGEKRVQDIFRKTIFPIENRVFHDLSLQTSTTFQMDSIFLTEAFATIFEVKNIAGNLSFKEHPPQLIREKATGEIDSFESPASQVTRYVELFQEWLEQRDIQLPIFGVVVLAYPKQIVKEPPKTCKVIFPNLIPSYIKSIKPFPHKIDLHTLDALATDLLSSHKEYIPKPICESYSIPKEDIQPGVRCLACGFIGMLKIPRSWHCPHCLTNDASAHISTVKDWFLIIGRNMSNRECRAFLQLEEDRYSAMRLLKSMNLPSSGTFRDRTYQYNFFNSI